MSSNSSSRRILFYNPNISEENRLLFWSDGTITDNNDDPDNQNFPGSRWLIHDGWVHYINPFPASQAPQPLGPVIQQLYLSMLAELILSEPET